MGHRRAPSFRKRSNAGFSLPAILVGAGLLGILALAVASVITGMQKQSRTIEIKGQLEDLRQTIRSGLDCESTLDPAVNPNFNSVLGTCPGGLTLIQKNSGGRPLFSANHSGPWELRANCTPTGLQVLVARPLGGSRFFQNPTTREPLDWTEPRSHLFKEGALPCAANFVDLASGRVNPNSDPPAPEVALCQKLGMTWSEIAHRCDPRPDVMCESLGYSWNKQTKHCDPFADGPATVFCAKRFKLSQTDTPDGDVKSRGIAFSVSDCTDPAPILRPASYFGTIAGVSVCAGVKDARVYNAAEGPAPGVEFYSDASASELSARPSPLPCWNDPDKSSIRVVYIHKP